MSLSISGSVYTIQGTVINKANNQNVADLHVIVYDKDLLKDDFLGIGVTAPDGSFEVSFDSHAFEILLDRKPDLYFIIRDAGLELLSTKSDPIKNSKPNNDPLVFQIDLSNDQLRKEINENPVAGWIGGFSSSVPAFAYPEADLTRLPMLDNMTQIQKLQRQQKVLWPEFSWNSKPGEEDATNRCYQMFAPDISRLGYTNYGRVFSIICPQQGTCVTDLGCMNVEVTVTGNRGWVNEETKEIAADMMVEGKIWFSPSAHQLPLVKLLMEHFDKHKLPFPRDKANAIEIVTYDPKRPGNVIFPLRKGLSTDFAIPDFAKHEGVAWSVANLGVEIGPIVPTGVEKVDKFNQLVLDVFNIGSGNMLKNGNTLTWNVWFTAPELVNQEEWANHAEKWRKSIDADHGSPDGPGTKARYYDGRPFHPLQNLVTDIIPEIKKLID